jgi:hypothetical protein
MIDNMNGMNKDWEMIEILMNDEWMNEWMMQMGSSIGWVHLLIK